MIDLNPRLIQVLEAYYALFFTAGFAFLMLSRKYRNLRAIWHRLLFVYALSLLIHAVVTLGPGQLLTMLVIGMLIILVIEWLAMKYDFWGRYEYSSRFTPILPGGMPLPVVVAWGTIIFLAYWGALAIFGFIAYLVGVSIPSASSAGVRIIISLIAASVAVGFDLVMDPVMVRQGHWQWKTPGRWYGVPFRNFAGWFISCEAVFVIVFSIVDPLQPLRIPFFSPPVQWLFVWLYLALMTDMTLDAIKMNLTGAAVVGGATLIFVGAALSFLVLG